MSDTFTLRDWIKQQRASGWSTSDLADALYNASRKIDEDEDEDEDENEGS